MKRLLTLFIVLALTHQASTQPASNILDDYQLSDQADSFEIKLKGRDVESSKLTYEIFAKPRNGTVTVKGDIATYTPKADYHGSDSFYFVVTDADNVTSKPTIVNITILRSNKVPVAIAPSNIITLAEDDSTTIMLSGSDEDGTVADVLTYKISTEPTNGSVVVNDNIATYTPNANYNGNDSFAFTVTDADNATSRQEAIVNIRISPVNDAPLAIAGAARLAEDSSATIILRGSDVDDKNVAVTDLIYLITTQPDNGTAVAKGNVATYTPNANYYGNDSFAFTVTDRGNNGNEMTSKPAVVSITILSVNDTPVAIAPSTAIKLAEDSTTTIMLSGSDIDGAVADLTYQITTQPANGTVAISSNIVIYTPSANYHGNDSFAFTVTDRGNNGNGTVSEPTIVNITILPVKDIAVAIAPASTAMLAEDSTTTIILSGTAVDTATADLTYQITTRPANGSVVVNDNIATYTPNANYNGNDNFAFTVTDGNGTASETVLVNIAISPINDVPVAIAPVKTIKLRKGSTTTILLSGTDVDGAVADLTYRVVSKPTNGSMTITSVTNDGVTNNGSTNDGNIVTYAPSANYTGDDSFTFTVTDNATPQATSLPSIVNIVILPPPKIYNWIYKSGFKTYGELLTSADGYYTAQRVGASYMLFASKNLGVELRGFGETGYFSKTPISNVTASSTSIGYGGGLVLFKYLIAGGNIVNFNNFKVGSATLDFSAYSETYLGLRIPIKDFDIEIKRYTVKSNNDSINQLFDKDYISLALGYKFY